MKKYISGFFLTTCSLLSTVHSNEDFIRSGPYVSVSVGINKMNANVERTQNPAPNSVVPVVVVDSAPNSVVPSEGSEGFDDSVIGSEPGSPEIRSRSNSLSNPAPNSVVPSEGSEGFDDSVIGSEPGSPEIRSRSNSLK